MSVKYLLLLLSSIIINYGSIIFIADALGFGIGKYYIKLDMSSYLLILFISVVSESQINSIIGYNRSLLNTICGAFFGTIIGALIVNNINFDECSNLTNYLAVFMIRVLICSILEFLSVWVFYREKIKKERSRWEFSF